MSASCDFTQHDYRSALHDGDTSETFAVLEGINNKWLLGLENTLSHFVGLEGNWAFQLLVSSFFSNFPVDLGHSHSGSSSSDEGDGAITNLQFSRVVQNTNLRGEVLDSVDGAVGLEDHNISNSRHVLLLETLNVESTVVTRYGLFFSKEQNRSLFNKHYHNNASPLSGVHSRRILVTESCSE
jgi:hypothetical protein